MSEEEISNEEEVNRMNLDLARTPDNALATIGNMTALEVNFSRNLYDLSTSDMALKVGEKVFHTHQLVLWAWSPKFRQLLQDISPGSLSIDNGQQIIQLELHEDNYFIETYNDFLSFLYSGKISLEKDKVWNMYDLASTYSIKKLQEIIKQYLANDRLTSSFSKMDFLNFMKEAKMRGMFAVFNHFRKKLLCYYWVEELPPDFTVKVQNFSANFWEIFDDKSTSDVVIQTEKREFHLHSLLLRLQSETFKELFDEHTAGKAYRLDRDLYCGNEETLKDILKFLYTEKIDLDFRTATMSIKIAKKLQINTLVDVCTTFLEEYAIRVPFNDKLIHCLQETELLEMKNLHDIFYQIFLANFFLFSDRLLPTMGNDLLCQMLESSDLVAYNEYSLFCTLLPRLVELKENDCEVFHKILSLIRFHQMSVSEIKEISELDFFLGVSDDIIMAALLYRCSLWEQTFTKIPPNLGPRLYLQPPGPCITVKTFHNRPQLSMEEHAMCFAYKLNSTNQDMCNHSYILKQERDGDPFTICKSFIVADASWCHDQNRTLTFRVKIEKEEEEDEDSDDHYIINNREDSNHKEVYIQTTSLVVLYRGGSAIAATMKKCPLKLITDHYDYHKLQSNHEICFEFDLPNETIVDDNEIRIQLYMFTKPQQKLSTVRSVKHE